MSKLLFKKKEELKKANAKFKINLELEKSFFGIPLSIQSLKKSSLSHLDSIEKQILKDGYKREETKKFLRTDYRAKTILKYTSTNISDDSLSQILLSCYDESGAQEISSNIDANDLLSTVDSMNDIDKEIDNKNTKKLISRINDSITKSIRKKEQLENQIFQVAAVAAGAYLYYNALSKEYESGKQQWNLEKQAVENEANKLLSYTYILQHIIDIVKDLFTRTDHPSKYRTKYIQRLIRNTYALMKDEYTHLKQSSSEQYKALKISYESLLSVFKTIDNILIAISMVTSIYIISRVNLSKRSKETLKKQIEVNLCDTNISIDAIDVSIHKKPFQINLDCPIPLSDESIVPHEPISEKLKNLSCEIIEKEQEIKDAVSKEDLVTIAVIENKRSDKMNSIVSIDSFVNQKTQIANLNGITPVFSPLEGYVDKIEKDTIVIRDIFEPTEDYLTTQINLLNEKYERLNSVKSFLKNYYIRSLYPAMLSISTVDDASTRDESTGIEKEYKSIRDKFYLVEKGYEKQMKRITGKDNVEEKAKNETLYKIKEEVEQQEEIFFKHTKLLGEAAINASKITKAKPNEYLLFEYYILNLGAVLNGLDNPDKLEIEYRDSINEFARIRFVLDGYNKQMLADKINQLIKDIEKGISRGDFFEIALRIYSRKKKLEDVKKWLTDLANKNNKLEATEKTTEVNRVMFLFELFLNIDSIVKKYNILKKETTIKKQTVKEGGYISVFLLDRWKEYDQLQKDIEQIQKVIDSLSLFSTYSIIEYEGKQARLYTISEDFNCEPKETDPYLNPRSKYEFKDIQYWMKYCSYATLFSVLNPAFGWSTGWIFPSPILFPVIYIPIKCIGTKYGFIVVGISICGIWIFPWSLFVNLSTQYSTPFADPTTSLKIEIQTLKKEISERIIDLKKATLKPLLEQAKKDIDQSKSETSKQKQQLENNRRQKPIKYVKNENLLVFSLENGVKVNENYRNEYLLWRQKNIEIQELIVTSQMKTWMLEQKYSILKDAYDFQKTFKGVDNSLDSVENFLNSQLDRLEKMVDNINKILSTLPISLQPETANFGITLKNPKPIINIAEDLDDNIDEKQLTTFFNKFRLKNSDFLSPNYENQLSDSIVNFDVYKKELSSQMKYIIKKDAFPSYQLLTPTNLPWVSFLTKDFVKVGATTYGWPGFAPFPTT